MQALVWASSVVWIVMCVSGKPCQPDEFECLTGECVPEAYICDFSHDCSDGSEERNCTLSERCDFEDGLCDLQTPNSNKLWTRGSCLTDPGPPLDHIGNPAGHYLFLNSESEEIATAEISSQFFLPSESCTVTFYYHIGQAGGELQVLVRSEPSGEKRQIWIQTRQNFDPLSKPWIRTAVTFRQSQEFQVIFHGLVFGSSNPNEVIAFDDLSFSPGCVLIKERRHVSSASPSPLDCGAGVFVDPEQVCDFTLNCPHGEDEANCPALCDFESNACGWHELAPDDGFDWIRSSPQIVSTDQQHKAPPRDHSTNTSTGHFLLVLRNSSRFSQHALLQSPTYQQAGPDCKMTFWHYNAGISVGAANMYLQIKGMDNITVLWRTLYNQGNVWQLVTIQLGRQKKPFQISVSKLSLGVYDGISALDDITFHNCSLPSPKDKCPTPDYFHCRQSRACVDRLKLCDLVDDCGDGTDEENCSSELMCNFEDGLCSWTQDKEDMFDWTWNQGPTPTPNTGPFKDHTWSSVSGHYLFIESSAPQQFKDTAVLISRPFNPTISKGEVPRATCVFRFHYHMLGQYVFRLAIYIRNTDSGRGQMLWVRHGDQGNLWHRKTLYINSARPFQILVEGTVGDDFTGDIAIDDLSFLGCEPYKGALPSLEPSTLAPVITQPTLPPHSCQPGQFVCGVYGECVSQNQVCDFRQDCSDGADEKGCVMERCDFEGGNLCGWTLDSPKPPVLLHAFQWLIGQGETIYQGEEFHRPVNDHSLGTAEGWYIYADSSNGGYGHVSDLITPPITATGPQCTMEFWYYMSGFTVGTLQVLIKSGNVTHEVWSETGNQGSRWMRGKVFIGIRHNFQVILCSKRGVSYMGDVVVDDVEFTDCAPPLFYGLPCTNHEFACANGLCIPGANLCDFIDHCGDGSDENHYICKGFHGHCNFEFDLCSWHQLESDNSDWLIKAGRRATVGTSPATDHTLRNPSGHYLYKENSFVKSSGDMARISSPVFSQSSRECKMVFYLHMSGEGAGTLSVYMITKSSLLLLLNLTGYQGNYWIRQEVPLISKEHFQVMFEGRMGQNGRGDISIDDITFSPGCLFNHDSKTNLPDPMQTGSCPQGLLCCDNGACYKPEQLCNFIDDCGDNSDEKNCGTSCSFEDGRCGWKSSLADNFYLMLGTGSARSIRPPYDHTLMNENGHFLYLASTPVGLKGDKAHMRSFVYKESSATCKLAFWYYISHKATGVIRLYLKTENELKEVWMEQRMMPEWRRAEVPLRNLRNFELIFEVVRARDVSGGAALDDLQFINCARSGTLPGSCPAASDFVCNNGNCIVSSLVCDSKADCTDGSDELDCSGLAGACNFNMPEDEWEAACQLVQDQDDDFDWQIGHGNKHQGRGPSTDHSPDGSGSYLFVNSTLQREGDVARIITQQEFPASTGVCHLRFWFHMYGSKQMGMLKVHTVGTSGIPLLMWAASGNYGNGWHYSNVLLSNPHPFRVSFQADVVGNNWTDIAIDDLSFTQECAKGALVTPVPPTCNLEQFQCVYLLECISLVLRCDGEVDCMDGSDEEDCGTVPPQKGCKDTEYHCGKNMCIPSLLRCDSVADCPNGEDEYGCPVVQCAIGELVCEETASCIVHNQRCDQTADCPAFKSDESSCNDCPTGYCLNNGMCTVEKHGPLCICKSMWTGNRCHVQHKPTPPTTSVVIADTRPVIVYIALSVAVILILAVVIGTFLLCFIQRKRRAKDSRLIENDELENDAAKFREQFPDVRPRESAAFKARWSKFPNLAISVYPWRDEPEFPAKLSFSNPLYKEPKCSEA